ncbi:unnamed protein product [Staurois parvus]|uniref:Uncharacterized protein n=1 Tax=Staurois parvus TaxID=386267 RepID=A0ABN9BZ58_9NEOB|nr:unnamed protein product [Staurois parvus]
MGPTTDPGPSGSARVSKWSVRPWWHICLIIHPVWANQKRQRFCLDHVISCVQSQLST